MSSLCQNDRVTVVAGGWSVKGENFALDCLPGVVIAVNDSALHIPRVDYIVSMDRLWIQERWNFLTARRLPTFLRLSAARLMPDQIAAHADWLRLFHCDNTSAEYTGDPLQTNGPNSGICALNLALCMKPKQLFILGFDYCLGPNGEAYWYDKYDWNQTGPKPGKLLEWAHAVRAVKIATDRLRCTVFNCSSRSKVDLFARLNALELAAIGRKPPDVSEAV